MPSSSSNFIMTKTTRMYLYYYILISIFTMFIICIDNTNSVVHSSNSKMLNKDKSRIMDFSQKGGKSGKAGKHQQKGGSMNLKRSKSSKKYPNGQIKVKVAKSHEAVKPLDPKKRPLPSGRVPMMPIVPPGGYPHCCTICTREFYHGLALLELPPAVEKQTLDNFHDTYNHILGSFDNSNKDKQKQKKTVESSHQVEFLEEFSSLGKSFSFADRKGGKKKPKAGKAGKGGSESGSGFRNIGKNLQKGSGKQGKSSESQSASNLGKNDITKRLEDSINKAKKVPGSLKKTWVGQQGPGPCCNICPTWFVPHNSPKMWSRGLPGIPSYGGPDVASFIEIMEKSSSKNRFGGISRVGQDNGGFSQCCNVCTGGDSDIPMGYHTFIEMKEEVLSSATSEEKVEAKSKLNIESKSKDQSFLEAMEGAPAREGQCCYMCTLNTNGGWDDSEPFSDPQTEPQSIETRYTNDDMMRKMAFYRTYFHGGTVDHNYANNKPDPEAKEQSAAGVPKRL